MRHAFFVKSTPTIDCTILLALASGSSEMGFPELLIVGDRPPLPPSLLANTAGCPERNEASCGLATNKWKVPPRRIWII